jgi:hypothetical protein
VSSESRLQVGAALAAVRRDADGRPTWLGRPLSFAAEEESETFPVASLASVLYRSFYRRGGVTSLDSPESAAGPGARRRLLETLATAVPDRLRWDDGWRLVGPDGAALVVEKDGLSTWASANEWRSTEGNAHSPGARGALRLPTDRWDASPGFLVVQGNRLPAADPSRPRSRIYLDLDVEGAHRLLGTTGGWNAAGLPFLIKVLADPLGFERCDTVVVVLERRDVDRAGDAILESLDVWVDRLRAPTPAFARRIGPGLAIADDPPDGGSFGMLRCRQLAEGIARADREGARSRDDGRLPVVETHFNEAGVSLDALHLGPGSPEYDLQAWKDAVGYGPLMSRRPER